MKFIYWERKGNFKNRQLSFVRNVKLMIGIGFTYTRMSIALDSLSTYLFYPYIMYSISFKHFPITYTKRMVSIALKEHLSRFIALDFNGTIKFSTLFIMRLVLSKH